MRWKEKMTSTLSTCISVQRNNFKISSSVKLKKKKKYVTCQVSSFQSSCFNDYCWKRVNQIATRQWNGPVFGQTSITNRLEYFASRSYKSSSLVKPETEQRSKLIISKANLISLYSLFPHLCCLADKRLFSLLSFFFFTPLFSPPSFSSTTESIPRWEQAATPSRFVWIFFATLSVECQENRVSGRGEVDGKRKSGGIGGGKWVVGWIRYFLPRGSKILGVMLPWFG